MSEPIKFFRIQELVSPETYEKLGPSKCWGLFPQRVVDGLRLLREDFGKPISINDWSNGGNRKYSGHRPRLCRIGAEKSAHKDGLAFDLHGRTTIETEALRALIKANWRKYGITRMEDSAYTNGWVHVDWKITSRDVLTEFIP